MCAERGTAARPVDANMRRCRVCCCCCCCCCCCARGCCAVTGGCRAAWCLLGHTFVSCKRKNRSPSRPRVRWPGPTATMLAPVLSAPETHARDRLTAHGKRRNDPQARCYAIITRTLQNPSPYTAGPYTAGGGHTPPEGPGLVYCTHTPHLEYRAQRDIPSANGAQYQSWQAPTPPTLSGPRNA